MGRDPDLREREQMAGRILCHIGENWKKPLDWNFRVEYVPTVEGAARSGGNYWITARQERCYSFKVAIGARKARAYQEINKAIRELEMKAVSG